MKKGLIAIIVAAAVVLAVFAWVKNSYNSFVSGEEQVSAAWAQVENVYQRRADLIPNLVATVKGYASHEQETLESVIAARSRATSVTVDPSTLSEEQIAGYSAAQSELGSTLGRLLMIAENYPDLKANTNFLELQAQLEGTENRIATERQRYTEAVRDYNTEIKKFPTNIYAGWFGFTAKPQFTAEAGAEKAPEVKF